MRMGELLRHFPKPLLEDLVSGRWLPIVGAGFSANARVPGHKTMPLWDEIGRALAQDLSDYPYVGPVDAASAYSHEFSRPKLLERLRSLLLIDVAAPGRPHEAFCAIPFRTVCTTNFDFLLERQYELSGRYCQPIVEEAQLTVRTGEAGTDLLKVHGDLHHPSRLVVTEEDYDCFLDRYPLLATHLASLLIKSTPVLFGYSLDDPDFRHVWAVITERLGASSTRGYAVLVGARPAEISRFERRNVKVISLPGDRSEYGEVLAEALTELKDYLQQNIIGASVVVAEDALRELTLPADAASRMAFFAVPVKTLAFYREYLFPIAQRFGFVPVAADEVIAPGENFLAKIEALVARAALVVVDVTSSWGALELSEALRFHDVSHVLAVTAEGLALPRVKQGLQFLVRPGVGDPPLGEFLLYVSQWFEAVYQRVEQHLADEPMRLFDRKEYRAAVASAVALLEWEMRRRVEGFVDWSRKPGLSRLVDLALEIGVIDRAKGEEVKEWIALRNRVVHTPEDVPRRSAKAVVDGVQEVITQLLQWDGNAH